MKVVFFGTPNFAIPTLERLLEHPSFEVLAVVTQPDKRRGRGNQTTASPVKSAALTRQIPVFSPQRLKKDVETLNQLRVLGADIFVVIAYGQILSQEILDIPPLGCINVHGSILPKYRGAAPINWCLYHGETQTGITTMLMDAGMDTGAMLLKATIPIDLADNALVIADKLANLGADLLVETLVKWQRQEITPIAQDNAQATYALLLHKSDYVVDWHKSAIALHNQVRGFFPNCTTTFRGQLLKILASVPLDATDSVQLANSSSPPGTVVAIIKGMGAAIQTGDRLLLLTEVQLAGKKPQSGGDFVNGNRLLVGEVLKP
ncbi:methionyl-tRNA formyltransferase [Synechocystis sp. PCC 7509]|uniref:methionyl-tRNA formyltransferase n=1 Tax=Synechocystis sp. PCC 7509 TaxID=927677 RepID=UPI0002AC0838|nr:methionyl-tRNA formyltransferase [Synechocystis sp. PCC 7509]